MADLFLKKKRSAHVWNPHHRPTGSPLHKQAQAPSAGTRGRDDRNRRAHLRRSYLSGVLVHSTARGSRAHDNRHALDYRHFIGALKRKSQAFKGLAFRDALFPREAYRRTWEQRDARLSQRDACKTMVSLLELAGLHGVGPYWQGSFMRTTTTPLGRSRIQCPRWCEF